MKQIKILSRVDDTGVIRKNRKLLADAFKHFAGKDIEVIVKRKYKSRSLPQNAFYWGVTLPFFQNLFHEAWGEIRPIEEIHEVLKATCNYTEIPNPVTGEVQRIPQSTTELTTSGWMDFELQMDQFARDFFNATLPKPNEQTTLEL